MNYFHTFLFTFSLMSASVFAMGEQVPPEQKDTLERLIREKKFDPSANYPNPAYYVRFAKKLTPCEMAVIGARDIAQIEECIRTQQSELQRMSQFAKGGINWACFYEDRKDCAHAIQFLDIYEKLLESHRRNQQNAGPK